MAGHRGRLALPSKAVVLLAPKRLEGSSSDSAVRTHGEVAGRVEMQQKKLTIRLKILLMWSPAVLCLSTDELGPPLLCIVPASTELPQPGKDLWLQSLLVSPCAPRVLSPRSLVQ